MMKCVCDANECENEAAPKDKGISFQRGDFKVRMSAVLVKGDDVQIGIPVDMCLSCMMEIIESATAGG